MHAFSHTYSLQCLNVKRILASGEIEQTDGAKDEEPRLGNLSGLVTTTELTHKEPSLLNPLKLIDPINIQTE